MPLKALAVINFIHGSKRSYRISRVGNPMTYLKARTSGGFRISSKGFLEISSEGGDNLPGGGEKIAL